MIYAACQRFPKFETDRLILRSLIMSDAGAIVQLYGDGMVIKFLGLAPLQSFDDALDFIAEIQAKYQAKTSIHWGIVDRQSGQLIGKCCLYNGPPARRRAEIGYALGSAWWGKGLMREALFALLTFLFEEMGMDTILARVNPDNVRSVRLLRRLAFSLERSHTAEDRIEGKGGNIDLYSLSQQIWAKGAGCKPTV